MEEINRMIQSKLEEIDTVDSGVPIPDGLVQLGQTYFGYELEQTYVGSDLSKNYTMQISIVGRLVRYETGSEDTLQIMREETSRILDKLKELNFKCSSNDVSIQDRIRKIQIKGTARYNEINNLFIV